MTPVAPGSASPASPADPADPVTVPPGPGVQPPFVAAPIEGRSARRWLSGALAAVLLAACCGMGVAAFGGLFFTMVPAMNEQARRAVGDYLDALVAGEWRQAYEQTCEADRRAESLAEFTDRVSRPRIESYELGELNFSEIPLRLPADLVYASGRQRRVTYPLVPNPEGGRLQVCEHA